MDAPTGRWRDCSAYPSRRSANGASGSLPSVYAAFSTNRARVRRGLGGERVDQVERSISDELVQAVLAKTLHEPPVDAERWSSRRLASELGISQRAVLRIWRAFEL